MADTDVDQKRRFLDLFPWWIKLGGGLGALLVAFFGGNQAEPIHIPGEPSYWQKKSDEQTQIRINFLEEWRSEASQDIKEIKTDVAQILANQIRQREGLDPLPSPRRKNVKALQSNAETKQNPGG